MQNFQYRLGLQGLDRIQLELKSQHIMGKKKNTERYFVVEI